MKIGKSCIYELTFVVRTTSKLIFSGGAGGAGGGGGGGGGGIICRRLRVVFACSKHNRSRYESCYQQMLLINEQNAFITIG